MNSNRRVFLKSVIAGLSLFGIVRRISAQVLLKPDEQLAKSLGYYEDATKVDAKRWPTWKAGNVCSNCNLYKAVDGDKGTCTIFQGKWVKAKGWCSTWIPIVPAKK